MPVILDGRFMTLTVTRKVFDLHLQSVSNKEKTSHTKPIWLQSVVIDFLSSYWTVPLAGTKRLCGHFSQRLLHAFK